MSCSKAGCALEAVGELRGQDYGIRYPYCSEHQTYLSELWNLQFGERPVTFPYKSERAFVGLHKG